MLIGEGHVFVMGYFYVAEIRLRRCRAPPLSVPFLPFKGFGKIMALQNRDIRLRNIRYGSRNILICDRVIDLKRAIGRFVSPVLRVTDVVKKSHLFPFRSRYTVFYKPRCLLMRYKGG